MRERNFTSPRAAVARKLPFPSKLKFNFANPLPKRRRELGGPAALKPQKLWRRLYFTWLGKRRSADEGGQEGKANRSHSRSRKVRVNSSQQRNGLRWFQTINLTYFLLLQVVNDRALDKCTYAAAGVHNSFAPAAALTHNFQWHIAAPQWRDPPKTKKKKKELIFGH